MLSFLLWNTVEAVGQMQHEIAGQGSADSLRAALTVDNDIGRRQLPEDVETLCARCDRFAKNWQPVADELWKNNPHPKPKTQYYRDMDTSKDTLK